MLRGRSSPRELVDTGTAVSVILEWTQKWVFLALILEIGWRSLETYTNEQMSVLDEMAVEVQYEQH